MSKVIPLRLIEIEEEDETDLFKEVGDAYPRFEFEPFGSANGRFIVVVNVNGNFIGSLSRRDEQWAISFVENRKMHTFIPVTSKEEGAEKLWQDRIGILQLPEIKQPREPLDPIPDDPDHYESVRKTAVNLVKFLAEEDPEDDFDDPRDVSYDQLDMITSSLDKAGFKIIRADRNDEGMSIEFSWPALNAVAYVNGWKRAKEVIEHYMPLRHGNYTMHRTGEGNERTAIATVTKRPEEDPSLWKVQPLGNAGLFNAQVYWYEISFGDKKVGEAYLPIFGPSGDIAELLREELSELNEIVPFNEKEWPPGGNAFGGGPAINWWRKNRTKLKSAARNTPLFEPKLIGD